MDEYYNILKKYWGFTDFRPQQLNIIDSIIQGKDTLALLPTGGGKSLCFQIPALLKDGICIVITPLIALMKDQTERLKSKNIPALSLFSGMTRNEIDNTLDRCVYDTIKFLYVSPERLQTEIFKQRILKMNVNLLAVDEAHCISQWGYDFRPSYLEIANIRELLPNVPVIALTASATTDVVNEIQEKLHFKIENVFRSSFARKNLSYSVFELENKEEKIFKILKSLKGSAIIYVRSRKKTEQISSWLNYKGISCGYYHAGLNYEERDAAQQSWINNNVRVMCATNAFGMGIDKSDVTSVIHYDIPENLESFYQEAGRAGRNNKKAYAVLLFHTSELETKSNKVLDNHPEIPKLKRVYQALANYYKLAEGSNSFSSFNFDMDEFCKIFKFKKFEVFTILKILEKENLIQFNESFYDPSKIMFILNGPELYDYQIINEKHDHIIKMILRMYGGEIFSGFMVISELNISINLSSTKKELVNQLNALKSNGVIDYIQQKDQPQITFLTPRLDAQNLPLNIALLNARKKIDIEKNESIIQYCIQTTNCRTLELIKYFGEENQLPCAICDICLQKKRNEQAVNTTLLEESVLKSITTTPIILNELIEQFKPYEKEIIIIIRKLIDEQVLEYSLEGKIKLKNL